jgi:hypothetical protein
MTALLSCVKKVSYFFERAPHYIISGSKVLLASLLPQEYASLSFCYYCLYESINYGVGTSPSDTVLGRLLVTVLGRLLVTQCWDVL